MVEPNHGDDVSVSGTQKEILNELKRNNELLERLLDIQSNVQGRQRKFWFVGLFQIAVMVAVLLWFGSKYGF
jgi:hypothetical protein